MESFRELASHRQSCRNYSDQPVEDEKLHACIETAQLAPSACNGQPWHFTVINGGEAAHALAKCLQGGGMNSFTSRCPAFIVVEQTVSNLSSRVGGLVKHQDYASVDIGLTAAHICFEAADRGLSTCILGWFEEGAIQKLLKLEKGRRVRLVIAVGYAADEGLRKKQRKPIEDICTFIHADLSDTSADQENSR